MAFDAGTIVTKLKMDSKGFTAGITAAGGRVKSFGAKMTKLSNLVKLAIGGVVVSAFVSVGKAILNATEEGGRLIDLTRTFERLAEASGVSASQLIRDAKKITGALTNRQLIEAANTLDILGVGIEQLPKFVGIAKAAAIGLNKTIPNMLESISTGTARQSKLWLDNLGIIISVDAANKKYADSLGLISSKLTDTEKRAAFLNAVLEKGDVIIDKVGSSTESAANNVQTLSANFANLADNIKKHFGASTVVGGIISKLNNLFEAEEQQRFINRVMAQQERLKKELGPLFLQESREGLDQFGGMDNPLGFKFIGFLAGQEERIRKILPELERQAENEKLIGSTLQEKTLQEKLISGFKTEQLKQSAAALELAQQITAEAQKQATLNAIIANVTPRNIPTAAQSLKGLEIPSPGFTKPGTTGFGQPSEGSTLDGGLEVLENKIPVVDNLMQGLGNTIESTFKSMVDGSGRAGRAFMANMLASIGAVASNMGSFMLVTGIGMLGIESLNPFAVIAAGLALKAVGGLLQGLGSAQAPPIRSPHTPFETNDPNAGDMRGSTTFIVQGDFIGDRMWIDRLAEKLRLAQRDRSVEVVFA